MRPGTVELVKDQGVFNHLRKDNGAYKVFQSETEDMNSGRLYDTPATAYLMGKEICQDCLEDVMPRAKAGLVVNCKGEYIHCDVSLVNTETSEIICSTRNPEAAESSVLLKIEDVEEIFEVVMREF